MEKLKTLDLFAGIGGFALGLEATRGFETAAFCEIEEYPVKILNKHWPNVPVYSDVRELTNERLRADGIGIDVITGGFPCQDISVAGNQAGIAEGTRSGLWSECARLLGEIRPRYAIFENVSALLNGERGDWFKRVLGDISALGYDAEWHCISASAIGAKHHRNRVWILAYPNGSQPQRGGLSIGMGQEHANIDSGGSIGDAKRDVAYPEHYGLPTEPKLRCNEKTSDNRGQDREKISGEFERESRPVDVHGIRRSDSRSKKRQGKAGRNSGKKKDVAHPRRELRGERDAEGVEACKTKRPHSKLFTESSGERRQNATHASSIRQQGPGEYVESLYAKAGKKGKTIDAIAGRVNGIWKTEPAVCGVADGVSHELYQGRVSTIKDANKSARLKALGNAIVPQIAQIIGEIILENENLESKK